MGDFIQTQMWDYGLNELDTGELINAIEGKQKLGQ